MENVYAFLQALAGAGVVAAAATYITGVCRDRAQRRRERNGLLRLLYEEIVRNKKELEDFRTNPRWIVTTPEHHLETRTWDEVRVRLSQLLENERYFADFQKYYENVRVINQSRSPTELRREDILQGDRITEEDRINWVLPLVPAEIERGDYLTAHIREYVPDIDEGTSLKSWEFRRLPRSDR